MIEKNFDIPFIASLALREKQVQQNYRPVIAVHKWFARRPGTLSRGLLLSEFVDKPLKDAFYESNDLSGLRMADPFMGGGTPLMESNRVGCEVIGFDINPMSYWIVKEEIEHLDLKAYNEAARKLRAFLEKEIGRLYRTRCKLCNSNEAHVKYFLWVKVQGCSTCGKDVDLFPGYLIAEDKRHPKNVFVCHKCGALMGRDIVHFTEGLSAVFNKMSIALKPGSPLVFTYHHNKLGAYLPLVVAALDAGLTCSSTIPCPAEMGGSIHINKAASSIIDTVFVLRKTGVAKHSTIAKNAQELADIVYKDIQELKQAGVTATEADMRCIAFGHLIRLAIWNMRSEWQKKRGTKERLRIVEDWIADFGNIEEIISLRLKMTGFTGSTRPIPGEG